MSQYTVAGKAVRFAFKTPPCDAGLTVFHFGNFKPASAYDDDSDDTYEDEGWEDEAADELTIDCPYCGREVYEDADICPGCGQFIIRDDIREGHPLWHRSPLWVGLALAGIVATIVMLLLR